MASIALLGLESDLADQLARVLREQKHLVRVADAMNQSEISADILFAGGDGPDYRETVRRLRASHPETPLVLVNRHPENSRWLDALELGAADYCGAPFEGVQVKWLVNSVMRAGAMAAA